MIPKPKDMATIVETAQRFGEQFEELARALHANAIATRELAHQLHLQNSRERIQFVRGLGAS